MPEFHRWSFPGCKGYCAYYHYRKSQKIFQDHSTYRSFQTPVIEISLYDSYLNLTLFIKFIQVIYVPVNEQYLTGPSNPFVAVYQNASPSAPILPRPVTLN